MLQPGTPIVDLFPVGQAAFANPRRPNPPPGFGPRQVMSPTHNLLRASFTYINQNINRQQNAKEASARRVMLDAQLELEASQRERERENALRQELQQVQFTEALTLQRQAKLKNNTNSDNQGFVGFLSLSVPRYCDSFLGEEEASKVLRYHEQVSSLLGA